VKIRNDVNMGFEGHNMRTHLISQIQQFGCSHYISGGYQVALLCNRNLKKPFGYGMFCHIQFLGIRKSFFLFKPYLITLQEITYSKYFITAQVTFFLQHVADFGNGEQRMNTVTFRLQKFLTTLLSVQYHYDI